MILDRADLVPRQWFAIRTDVGGEWKAKDGLRERGIPSFCPAETHWKRQAGKKVRTQKPLFTGYMFVGLTPDEPEFLPVRLVDGVRGFVMGAGSPHPIPERFLDALRDAQNRGAFDYTREPERTKRAPIPAGTAVNITGGALAGFQAVVVKALGAKNARIVVELFGRASELTAKVAHLEPLPLAPA